MRAELLAVADDAADRDAAEADAVIAALAADEARARALALRAVIGERDLERGVDRLRARVAEEHVVEVARRERGEPLGELEGLRMAHLEGRRVVHLAACFWIAAMISSRPWPALTHHRPAVPSSTLRPSGVM